MSNLMLKIEPGVQFLMEISDGKSSWYETVPNDEDCPKQYALDVVKEWNEARSDQPRFFISIMRVTMKLEPDPVKEEPHECCGEYVAGSRCRACPDR